MPLALKGNHDSLASIILMHIFLLLIYRKVFRKFFHVKYGFNVEFTVQCSYPSTICSIQNLSMLTHVALVLSILVLLQGQSTVDLSS